MTGHHAPRSRSRWRAHLTLVGPGIAVAATGVGAGDLVAAAVSGSRYGFAVVWAAVVGAVLKFVLNEGLARWQLATGTTLLEGWVERLGTGIRYYFFVYLVVWSFVVGGALISACGLAAHAIAPILSVEIWGVVHSLGVAAVVLFGSYRHFERLMGLFIGFMFVTLVGCALWASPPIESVARMVSEAAVPEGGVRFILGIVGGVGGSLTLLSYGYWIRERGWEGASALRLVRVDLVVAYLFVGVFGVAVTVLASSVLHAGGVPVQGSEGVVVMSRMLGDVIGPVGTWAFRIGFWCAVTTSMLGVWQGVPYLFSDFVALTRRLSPEHRRTLVDSRSAWYRGYLGFLGVSPIALLYFGKPVGLIVLYAVVGALFMPFLAGTLFLMNSRREWVGEKLRDGWTARVLLLLCLALFVYLGWSEIRNHL